MKNDRISIIVASYNSLDYIKDTINSILCQDYSNIELIIADDCTEGFYIDEYKNYIENNQLGNIRKVNVYTNSSNLGTVKNMNKAVKLATGKYIKLIGADDTFYNETIISSVINYMQDNEELIVTTNLLLCGKEMSPILEADEWLDVYKTKLPLGKQPKEFFKFLAIGKTISPGVFFKREFFNKYGKFDEQYKLLEDWPTWLKVSRSGIKIGYLDIISVKYRVDTGVSNTSNKSSVLINDIIKCYEREILPFKKDLGYWLHKNIQFKFIRKFKYSNYTFLKMIIFIVKNVDIILCNRYIKISNKVRNKK